MLIFKFRMYRAALYQALILNPEPSDYKDKYAVAVLNDYVIYDKLLRSEINKAFPEVTREKVNRGAGYGLEISCVPPTWTQSLH